MGAGGAAFWVSPRNQVFEVADGNHMATIIRYPEKFGFTSGDIQRIFDRHHERLGQEGLARDEIILSLIRKGWIRIRKYSSSYWSILIDTMNKLAKDVLFDWSKQLLAGVGLLGNVERDPYAPVKITDMHGHLWQHTIQDIAKEALYSNKEEEPRDKIGRWTKESFDPRNSLIPLESPSLLEDMIPLVRGHKHVLVVGPDTSWLNEGAHRKLADEILTMVEEARPITVPEDLELPKPIRPGFNLCDKDKKSKFRRSREYGRPFGKKR